MLLQPEFLERLARLSLSSRGRLRGAYPGEHRSLRLGSSVDFADWRPYVEGDDFRRIDYQIYARLDRLVVRLYEAQDELTLRLVVDTSSSMGFDRKLEVATKLTGALAYLAGVRGDRARAWALDSTGLVPGPWVRSRDSAIALFSWLERLRPAGSTSLLAGLRQLSSAGATHVVTVLLSDLLTEEWEAALRRLGGPGAEAAVMHILAPSELEPEVRGDHLFVDSEAGGSVEVSISESALRAYRQRARDWRNAVEETCRRRGVAYALVPPDCDLETLLLVDLRKDGLVR
jgi:uncharacterized protein (DUF58 family)